MYASIHHQAHLRVSLACSVLIMMGSLTADAFPGRETQVPNNQWNCALCHTNPAGGGARTVFGEDTKNFGTEGGVVNWSSICDLDSDDDGATNGLELGDPACMWMNGEPNPEAMVTNPNDPASFPEEMMEVAGEEMMEVAGEEMMEVAGEEMMEVAGEEMMEVAGGEMMEVAGEEMMEAASQGATDDGCQSSAYKASNTFFMLLLMCGLIRLRRQLV